MNLHDAPSPPRSAPPAPTVISPSPWNHSLQTVLDQPPASLPQQLMVGGLLFACAFGAWAWFGMVQEVSTAQGRLVPKGDVYKVQPVIEGEVTKLHVQEGQRVKARQVLAELDSDLNTTDAQRLQQVLIGLETELKQTQDLIEKNRLEAENRQTIAQTAVDTHQWAISQAQAEMDTQQRLLQHFEADAAAFGSRLERLQPLVNEGAIAGEQLFTVEQSLRDRQRSMTESQGALQKSQVTLKQLQSQLRQKQAEKEQTHLESQQRLQELELKATELQAKIAETKLLWQQAQTRLNQHLLKAEVGGIVSMLNIKNTGEVIRPGQTLAEIAPAKTPLILTALLPSQKAGFVKTGMPVQVKFDAFPYQDYGTISGKVISVSPDAKMDEKIGMVYEVKVSLDRAYVMHDQKRVALKAGQTANVEIITRQQRIADLLLDPIRKLKSDRITL